MVLHKTCVGAGCLADPGFGYRSSPQQDYRWACLAHRGLLEVGAAVLPRSAAAAKAREGVGTAKTLPLPDSWAQGRLV
jgi:hypothetical protein